MSAVLLQSVHIAKLNLQSASDVHKKNDNSTMFKLCVKSLSSLVSLQCDSISSY